MCGSFPARRMKQLPSFHETRDHIILPTSSESRAPSHLVAIQRSPSTILVLAPPRHDVDHPLRLVSRAVAGPLTLEPVARLALAVRRRAAATSHVDHDCRLVKRAELCLLSLFFPQNSSGRRKLSQHYILIFSFFSTNHNHRCDTQDQRTKYVRTDKLRILDTLRFPQVYSSKFWTLHNGG